MILAAYVGHIIIIIGHFGIANFYLLNFFLQLYQLYGNAARVSHSFNCLVLTIMILRGFHLHNFVS